MMISSMPPPENGRVEVIHRPPQSGHFPDKPVLRVAAYARVSTLREEQEDSYQTQCAYYERLIRSSRNMVLAGVYGDQGVSGLSTRGRSGFARMMQDCKAGKIDYVITRSVSRLSRNMAECVQTVSDLREMGIPVRFEREGLTTTDPGSEMFFHVLATLAQEESGSTSRRLTWALQRRAEMGEPVRKCPYGYRREGAAWAIDESAARRVRTAFALAAEMTPYDAILHQLNQIEQAEGTGAAWSQERLHRLLRSEVYRGDVLAYKTYTVDYLAKKRRPNRGEAPRHYITGHHAPLIPAEVFERVQGLMDARLLHPLYRRARQRQAWESTGRNRRPL